MLLWQWKNGHKKIILWGHLVVGVMVLHLFLGILFFCYCRHGVAHIVLIMKKNVQAIPVTFMPYRVKKNVPSAMHIAAVTQKKNDPKKHIVPRKATVIKTKAIEKKEIKKTVTPKAQAQKKIQKEEKKIIPIKKEPVKEAAKPVAKALSDGAPRIDQVPLVSQQSMVHESIDVEPTEDIIDTDIQQAELYALVAQQWAPPVGIAHDKVCEVSAEIGWDHKAAKIWISGKSGILMYDIAARKAVMQTKFPLWTCGKTITIRFVQ